MFCLVAIGSAKEFKIIDSNKLFTGEKYTTKAKSTVEILGICDIDISINDIRCYE